MSLRQSQGHASFVFRRPMCHLPPAPRAGGAPQWDETRSAASGRAYLSVGALAQNLQQLELGGVRLFRAFLHMMADVDLLHDAFFLEDSSDTRLSHKPRRPCERVTVRYAEGRTRWVCYGHLGLAFKAVTPHAARNRLSHGPRLPRVQTARAGVLSSGLLSLSRRRSASEDTVGAHGPLRTSFVSPRPRGEAVWDMQVLFSLSVRSRIPLRRLRLLQGTFQCHLDVTFQKQKKLPASPGARFAAGKAAPHL